MKLLNIHKGIHTKKMKIKMTSKICPFLFILFKSNTLWVMMTKGR